MTDQTPDDQATSLTFLPYLKPSLPSGEASVEVEQVVSIDKQKVQRFYARQNFVVTGERYRLAAGTLNSLSPQDGARGNFSRQLPHVVLNNASLPWQRSPDPEASFSDPPASWLAVLLFDESDPPPKPDNLTLKDLVGSTSLLCPQRPREPGETDDTPVTVIDIDLALFNAIAPTLEDLKWNAHVRRVDPRAKASSDDNLAQSDYAVVVGNRLPAMGHAAVAHLVSLERCGDALPLASGAAGPAVKPDMLQVRLVSLANWSFSTRDASQGFTDRLDALDCTSLQVPLSDAGSANDPGDEVVKRAFGLGYTAMNHHLRNGDSSVSWYRGPLLPVAVAWTHQDLAPHPDALLRYDPDSGMFDVGYSAAWQLGRLLALQNGAFAGALYRWKLGYAQAQREAAEKSQLDTGLGRNASRGMRLLREAPVEATSRLHDVLSDSLLKSIERLENNLAGKES